MTKQKQRLTKDQKAAVVALRQVIDAMVDEGPSFLKDLSRSELKSFEELFHACETFMNHANELM